MKKKFTDDLRTCHIDLATKECVSVSMQWPGSDEEVEITELATAMVSYLAKSVEPPEEGEELNDMRGRIQPLASSIIMQVIKELSDHDLVPKGTLHHLIGSTGLRHTMLWCVMLGVILNVMLKKEGMEIFIEREQLDDDDIKEIMKQEHVTRVAAFFESIGIDPQEGFEKLNGEMRKAKAGIEGDMFDELLTRGKNEPEN